MKKLRIIRFWLEIIGSLGFWSFAVIAAIRMSEVEPSIESFFLLISSASIMVLSLLLMLLVDFLQDRLELKNSIRDEIFNRIKSGDGKMQFNPSSNQKELLKKLNK